MQILPPDEDFAAPDWLKKTGSSDHPCPTYYFGMLGYSLVSSNTGSEAAAFPWRSTGPMPGRCQGNPFRPFEGEQGDYYGLQMAEWMPTGTSTSLRPQCVQLLREEDLFDVANIEVKGEWGINAVGSAFYGSKTQGKKGSSPTPQGVVRLPTSPSASAATTETASLAVSPNLNSQTGSGSSETAFSGAGNTYSGWGGMTLILRAGGGSDIVIGKAPAAWSNAEKQYYCLSKCDSYALCAYPQAYADGTSDLVAELWRVDSATPVQLAKQVVTGGTFAIQWDQPYTMRATCTNSGGNPTFTAFIGKYLQGGTIYDEMQLFKNSVFTDDTISVGPSGDGSVNATTGVVTDSGSNKITATADKTVGFGMGVSSNRYVGDILPIGNRLDVLEGMYSLQVTDLTTSTIVYRDEFKRGTDSPLSSTATNVVGLELVQGNYASGVSLLGLWCGDSGGNNNGLQGDFKKTKQSLLWTDALNDITAPNDYVIALYDPDTSFASADVRPADRLRVWAPQRPSTQRINHHRLVTLTAPTGNSNRFIVGVAIRGNMASNGIFAATIAWADYTTDSSGNQTSLEFKIGSTSYGLSNPADFSTYTFFDRPNINIASKVIQALGASIPSGFDMTSGSHVWDYEVKTAPQTLDETGPTEHDFLFDGTAVTFDTFFQGAAILSGTTVTDPSPNSLQGGNCRQGYLEGVFYASVLLTQSASYGTFTPLKIANWVEGDLTPDPDPNVQPPQANNDVATVQSGGSVAINILDNDLAFNGATIDATSVVITSSPSKGTVTVSAAGVATYYSDFSTPVGSDNFSYTVSDTAGLLSTGSANVNVIITAATPPLATDDYATVNAGAAVAISVLTNDVAYGGATIVASTVAVVSAPSAGSTSVSTSGVITYTAVSSTSSSTVTFTYRFYDNAGNLSNNATVTVNCVGSSAGGGDPVANPDYAIVNAGSAVAIDVLLNDYALPGKTVDATSVAISSAPSAGSTSVNGTTGVITYTAAASSSDSSMTFAYTFDDNGGATSNAATVTVAITGTPAPTANADFANVTAGSSVAIAVLANDVPHSGHTIDATSVAITSAPTFGSTSVHGSTGVVTYTAPLTSESQTVTFAYTVDDNAGLTSNAATVSVSVAGVGVGVDGSIIVAGEGTASTNFSAALEAIDWSFSVEHLRPRYEADFESGHRYTSPKWGEGRRVLRGGAAGIPKVTMDAIVTFFNARQGADQAFTLNFPVPDAITNPTPSTMKVCFSYGGLKYQREAEGTYTATIELTELL